jgi:hypothetical protein
MLMDGLAWGAQGRSGPGREAPQIDGFAAVQAMAKALVGQTAARRQHFFEFEYRVPGLGFIDRGQGLLHGDILEIHHTVLPGAACLMGLFGAGLQKGTQFGFAQQLNFADARQQGAVVCFEGEP